MARSTRSPADSLVPGDVVLLATDDRVPADGHVVEETTLEVDEATLTGESLPTSKSTAAVADREAAIGDRTSLLYMATAMTAGRGRYVVTATGARRPR